MKLRLFDAHTHAHFKAYDADRDEVIRRALSLGIGMVNVGTDKKMSEEAIALTEKYPEGLFATVGLHPIHTAPSFHDASEGDTAPEIDFDYPFYLKLANHPRVVAIGECGLDYFHGERDYKLYQKKSFKEQIQLANEVGKPLMLHCRSSADGSENAYRDMIDILKEEKEKLRTKDAGIAHFFSGSVHEAEELLALGFSFTFGGAITLPPRANGADFKALIRMMPEERILLETDAPYVAPLKYRGKRNEPAYVEEVLFALANIRGETPEHIAALTLQNTIRAFNLTGV
jgi:TatD DNase family protein